VSFVSTIRGKGPILIYMGWIIVGNGFVKEHTVEMDGKLGIGVWRVERRVLGGCFKRVLNM
jgi:hypothetical protein